MLTVVTGPMFAGKTERLISIALAHEIVGHRVAAFKSSRDDRYSLDTIHSHSGHSFPCHSVEDIAQILELLNGKEKDAEVLVFEEVQFFPLEEFFSLIKSLLYIERKTIVVGGLSQDSNGQPFGAMPFLLAIADDIVHIKGICAASKQIGAATRTFRKNCSDTSQIVVGGKNIYEPRSFAEWLKK